jgi:hypothetical protein
MGKGGGKDNPQGLDQQGLGRLLRFRIRQANFGEMILTFDGKNISFQSRNGLSAG